jgi:hypothetical protein
MQASAPPRKVLAIVTEPLRDEEPIEQLRRSRAQDGDGVEVRVVVPAVEETAFRHTMGDIDGAVRQAAGILRSSIVALRRRGLSVSGEVGDPDPVLAAQDALREAPADEVLIFEHPAEQARWFESGLFERAQEELELPLRMVVVDSGDGHAHVVGVERGRAVAEADAGKEVGAAYLPGLSRGDFSGMLMGIAGTIVTIVLAAAGPNPSEGWGAVAVAIAIGVALLNMAYVVGTMLFETVHYQGGFASFFRTMALFGTPAAVLANLLILLLG